MPLPLLKGKIMKSQHMAVIFIIIILPIAMVMSYAIGKQIDTIKLQNQYNTSLNDATYDAIEAFKINTVNNRYSSISASKIRDIEASVSTFFNSLSDNEPLTEEQLKTYVPALVYTLYDGYYIYSKYDNTYPTNNGQPVIDENDLKKYEANYGLKPYIYYSCRYRTQNGTKDFIVNYTLDNAITVYGDLGKGYETKSGYLIVPELVTIKSYNKDEPLGWNLTYDGISIIPEQLTEHLLFADATEGEYDYIVYNGQKIYFDKDAESSDKTTKYFYYQDYGKSYIPIYNSNKEIRDYLTKRTNEDKLYSTSSFEYYYNAKIFTEYIIENIGDITQKNAVQLNKNNEFEKITFSLDTGDSKIFNISKDNNPLLSNSVFNENRMVVIRNSIETNLVAAIANYNMFSSNTYEFKLPVLYEYEWDKITNNVTLISFLQGLPIGYKYYNNYCVITNNNNEEVVKKENIYIIAESENGEREYHQPGCEHLLESKEVSYTASIINNTYALSSSTTVLSQPKIEIIGENSITEGEEKTLSIKITSNKSIGAIQGKIEANKYIDIIEVVSKNNWSKVIESNGSFIYTKAEGTKGQTEVILEIKYKGKNLTDKDEKGKVFLKNLILGEIIAENQTDELTHDNVEKEITVKKKRDYEIQLLGNDTVKANVEEKLTVKIISNKSIGAIQGEIITNDYINIIDITPINEWSEVIYTEDGRFIYTKAEGTKGQEEIILEIKYKGKNSTGNDVTGNVILTDLILGEIINENQTKELKHDDVEKNIIVKNEKDYEIQLIGEDIVDAGVENTLTVKIISSKSIGAIQGKIITNDYINIIDIVPVNNWNKLVYEEGNFIYTKADGTKGQEEIIFEIKYKGVNSTSKDQKGKVILSNLILGEIINENQTKELTHDNVEKEITVKRKRDYEILLLGDNTVTANTENTLQVKVISSKSIGAIQGKIETNEYIDIIDIAPVNDWNEEVHEGGKFIYTKAEGTKGQEEIILEIKYRAINSTGKDVKGNVILKNLILGEIVNESDTRELFHDDVEKIITIKDRQGLYTITAAYPNISFLRQTVRISEGNYLYFYPLTKIKAPFLTSCYYCMVNSSDFYEVEDIIKGEIIIIGTDNQETKINSTNNACFKKIRELYIRALGRERNHLYQANMDSFNI